MPLLQAIVLGIVQGITEFLPISSTAHLILVPWLLRWQSPGLVFDMALHLGTLLAVIWYFRHDLWQLVQAVPRAIRKRDFVVDPYHRLLGQLAVAVLPAGILGVLFEDTIEYHLRDPRLIGVTLIGVGLILAWADRRTGSTDMEAMTYRMAMAVGCAQAIALVPGVSRSGITMVAALAVGMQREASARFSFLLGLPVTAAAALFKLREAAGLSLDQLLYFTAGTLASAVSGYLCIRFLLRYLKSRSFMPFVVYRVALGVLVLAVATQLA